MDRVRDNQRRPLWKRRSWLAGATIAALIGIGVLGMTLEPGQYSIDRDRVRIGEVRRGPMLVRVSGAGPLRPREVHWVDAEIDGRVAKIVVRAGDGVAEGDLIAVLKNLAIHQQVEEAALLLDAALSDDEAFKSGLESEQLNQKARVLRARVAYESAKLQLDAHEELNRRNNALISEIDFQRTQLEVRQKGQIAEIEQELLENFRANMIAQLKARESKTGQLRRALQRIEQRRDALEIRATLNGVVQDVPVELGQQIRLGTTIAKLASVDQLYAVLEIPATQATAIVEGQAVEIDTRNDVIEGVVERIDPAVTQGKVEVDVTLPSVLPHGTRPDLEITGTIEVARIDETLHVERPTYSSSSRVLPVYVLDPTGSIARRSQISFGQSSVDRIQVLSGLEEGDRIILSDSSSWDQHVEVQLD